MDTRPLPVHLTVAQAADYAHVSARTIRRWIAAGRLHARGRGRARFIDRPNLECALGLGPWVAVERSRDSGSDVTMSVSMFVELAERLDAMTAELAAVRRERDQLADQLRDLAPGNGSHALSTGSPEALRS
jgi:excisionase family DNA binding protein